MLDEFYPCVLLLPQFQVTVDRGRDDKVGPNQDVSRASLSEQRISKQPADIRAHLVTTT